MLRRLSLALISAAALLAIQQTVVAQVIDTGRGEVLRGITVTGDSEVRTPPDVAYITLGARTREAKAGDAASQNAATMSKVMNALQRAGIGKSDIETVQYTLQPVYEYPQNAPQRLVGYEATNMVKVTIRDLSKVGTVVDAASGAGANVIQDVTFSVRDESAFKLKALSQAAQEARNKASTIASAMNVGLGNLLNVSEAGSPIITPYMTRMESAGMASTPISPQQISVRASVTATYGIMSR